MTASVYPAAQAAAATTRVTFDGAPPTGEVRGAIRLGWFIAEVRGRHWWRGQRPPVQSVPVDPPYALPLRPERTTGHSAMTT